MSLLTKLNVSADKIGDAATDINDISQKMVQPIKDIESLVYTDMSLDVNDTDTKEKGQLIELDFSKKQKLKEVPKDPK